MNSKEFTEKDKSFHKAIKTVAEKIHKEGTNESVTFADKIRTPRQASKFRRGTGIVWKTLNNMM
jgi:hypothetical protein